MRIEVTAAFRRCFALHGAPRGIAMGSTAVKHTLQTVPSNDRWPGSSEVSR